MEINENSFYQTYEKDDVEAKYNSMGLGTIYNPDINTLTSNLPFTAALLAVKKGEFTEVKDDTNLLNKIGQYNKRNLDTLVF